MSDDLHLRVGGDGLGQIVGGQYDGARVRVRSTPTALGIIVDWDKNVTFEIAEDLADDALVAILRVIHAAIGQALEEGHAS